MDNKLSQNKIYYPVVTTLLNDFDGSSGVVLTDDVPNIQCVGLPSSINLEMSTIFNPLGYVDYKGFPSSFSDDIIYIAKIESLIMQGPQFINILYSFRSISRAIPELVFDKNEKDPLILQQRVEYNSKIVNIIRPEINKIQELMYFVREATSYFQQCITFLSSTERKPKTSSSESLFLSLLKLLDILLKLDNLKDMKVSILADFNRLKRANGPNISIDALEEQKQLQNFLSCEDSRRAKQYIIWTLRSELKKIRGYEYVLIDLLDLSIECLDNQSYLTPDEKFRYRRVIPHLMILIDGDSDDTKSQNIFNSRDYNKRINLLAIQNILKSSPITPLLNDMAITLQYVVNKIPHYDSMTMDKTWGGCIDEKIVAKHNILMHWNFVKTSYTEFITRYTCLINVLVENPFEKVLNDKTKELSMNIYDLSLEGLHHLSSWSSLLQQIMAWKYTHPNSSK
jgi:cytoplasmic FMR1 interacting protein